MEDLIASAESSQQQQQAATAEVLATLDRIGIDKLTISDGTLIYRDRRSGTDETVTAMNLTLSAPDLARGASLDGSFTWGGRQETIALSVGARPDPTKLAALPVDLKVSDDLATIAAKGTALDGDTLFKGTVAANGGSLASLAGRFGVALPAAPAYGKFDASASLAATAKRTTLDKFDATLGDAKFAGQAVITTDGARAGHRPQAHRRVDRRRRLRRAGIGRLRWGWRQRRSGGEADRPLGARRRQRQCRLHGASGEDRLGGAQGSRRRRQTGQRHACRDDQQGDRQRRARRGQHHRGGARAARRRSPAR